MTTQAELFTPVSHGNLVRETPVVGRITFAPAANNVLAGAERDARAVEGTTRTPNDGLNPSPAAHIPGTEKKVSRMHFGNLATSRRLQDTLTVLQDGQWHTTREIRLVTYSEAVHSDIAGLRANGIDIVSECVPGRKWRYRVIEKGFAI